jgi:integrase
MKPLWSKALRFRKIFRQLTAAALGLLLAAPAFAHRLADRLAKWTQGGQFGFLFDNPEDTISFSRFQCFDFQQMSQYPDLLEPSATSDGVKAIVAVAKGQYQMLYALLAGCGPLRAGEALGLEIDKHISSDFRTLTVAQKAKRGIIQPYLKTKNGIREVDLCPSLAAMLKEYVGLRASGLLFCTSTGAQLLQANTLQDSLHPILDEMNHVKGGFNIFRRFRITHLEKSDCPEALKHFWSGHAPAHVSERYVKLLNDRAYRLDWAERVGTGFVLPVGQPGLLHVVRKTA